MRTLHRGQQKFLQDAKKIIEALAEFNEPVSISEFHLQTGLSVNRISSQVVPQLIDTDRIINGYRIKRTNPKRGGKPCQYWVEKAG